VVSGPAYALTYLGGQQQDVAVSVWAAEHTIANLRIERARVDGERKAMEADLGPVHYLATAQQHRPSHNALLHGGGAAARPAA
jgi:hypothetical protein